MINLGVAIGGGTGLILANIYKDCLDRIASKHKKQIKFHDSGTADFCSYQGIRDLNTWNSKPKSVAEAEQLTQLYAYWYNDLGIDAVFRTSVNAEALYRFRQNVKAVKEILIFTDYNNKILLIRDQAEGFYANETYDLDLEEVSFSGKYTRAHTKVLIEHANQIGDTLFGPGAYHKWGIYKHHLFGTIIEKWFGHFDADFKLLQPDTGFTEILEYLKQRNERNLLILASNEVGDLMYEPLMENQMRVGEKLDLYSKSNFLDDVFCTKDDKGSIKNNLVEYQTVHGSADDLLDEQGETNRVLPYATLRIASKVAQTKFNISKLSKNMDRIIGETKIEFFDEEQVDTKAILQFIYKKMKENKLI